MMRVLLVNPRTPPSFWTLPDLVRLEGCKALAPPLGLITVAGLLPQDWELQLVDLDTGDLTEGHWNWADLVFLSGFIVQKESMLAIIGEAKERGKTTVVGGPFATSVPQDLLAAGADFLFQGEAENHIGLLVNAIESGKKGEVFQIKEKPDMVLSPLPRFDLLTLDDYVTMEVQTSRGCPFNCEFCDIVNLYGRKPRYKSPDQVIGEFDALYRLGWRRELFIVDDNFIGNKTHAKRLLRRMIEWNESRGRPFNILCQASVNLGQDLEMIDLMTEANFYQVFVGVESTDKEALGVSRKYQNVRNPLLESIRNLNANGLAVAASFIIGLDGEKEGVVDSICTFVEKSGVPVVMLNVLQAAPNTQLWNRLKAEGRLLAGVTPSLLSGGPMNFVPSRPEREIMEEFVRGWEYMYDPSRFLSRAYRYYSTMRPTRRALARERGDTELPSKSIHKDSLRRKVLTGYAFFYLLWHMGIVSQTRRQFWKQLFGMRRKNPSRFAKYILSLVYGYTLEKHSRQTREEVEARKQTAASRGLPKPTPVRQEAEKA